MSASVGPASNGDAQGGGSLSERLLNGVERLGNKVPHPVLMFLYLIAFIFVVAQILYWLDVSVTEMIAVPAETTITEEYYEDTTGTHVATNPFVGYDGDPDFVLETVTIEVRPIFSIAGIRFLFTTFVTNFQNFGVVGVTFIAMLGAGAAEGAGLMGALIRKLVASAPRSLITFFIILVGAVSSIASDAGYLILIPLAAVAFMALGRHPIAGMAAGFAAVACTFAVNVIPQPIDAMLAEITNESIALTGGEPITLVNNYYFGVVSFFVLCIVATIVTERVIEPRLGTWDRSLASAALLSGDSDEPEIDAAAEARGLRYALFGFLAVLAVVVLATAPSGAPLRHPETGDIIGATPFMDSLLFIIALFFLISGIGYGIGAGTVKSANDVIGAITRTFSGLGGLIFMLLMISQFIAYFNYTNLPRLMAVAMADLLERLDIGALPLIIGFILVILLLDFVIPGVIPKWAIFAPVFIPIFDRLGIAPQTLLAAYRIGDSPVNALTPLMVYLPFIVTIAQRYRRDAGIGTVISIMLPYSIVMAVIWILLFIIWFLIGIPLGPGYPVEL